MKSPAETIKKKKRSSAGKPTDKPINANTNSTAKNSVGLKGSQKNRQKINTKSDTSPKKSTSTRNKRNKIQEKQQPVKKPMSAALRRALRGPKAGMLGDQTSDMLTGRPTGRSRKSTLTKKQINHFRELLQNKRHTLLGSVQALESDALRGSDSSTHKPFHPDDQSSEAYDQDFKLQLAASERQLLEEIDTALQRIEEGRFGICEATNKPIQMSRLEAKPWAHMCIEAARERDRRDALYPQV